MKRQSPGFLAWMLVIIALVASALLPWRVLDRLFLPWAFEHGGRPALTGDWVGALTTATGRPRGVRFEMYLPEPGGDAGLVRDWRSAPYGELAGTARVCDERGQVRSYTIDGEPEDRQATRLSLHASPAETPAPEGLTLSWIKGAWDRAGRLDLLVTFYWEKDGAAISGAAYPATRAEAALRMTRGGAAEFRAVCARARRRAL
jgi:hypothetical protein